MINHDQATISSGTAKNAPTGPHSQVQNTNDKNTVRGLSVNLRPMMLGVMKCPSKVASARKSKRRNQRMCERRERHQADHEQRSLHDQRTDIRNEIEDKPEHCPGNADPAVRSPMPQIHHRVRPPR